MHREDEFNSACLSCGLTYGELIQDEEAKKLLIMFRAAPTRSIATASTSGRAATILNSSSWTASKSEENRCPSGPTSARSSSSAPARSSSARRASSIIPARQAVKALKAEGYRVVLVNSNPATIMTDPELADATYIEPITPEIVAKIIEKERPEAVLPTMGGQTALNCALALATRARWRNTASR